MTVLLPEPLELESIDIEIPCDTPPCEDAAAWIVTWNPAIAPCGCRPNQLVCSKCLGQLNDAMSIDAMAVCPHGDIGRLREVVVRIEPL